jgi:hypothetical protein
LFSRSNSEFVAGYRSARVVVDRTATHTTKKAPWKSFAKPDTKPIANSKRVAARTDKKPLFRAKQPLREGFPFREAML